MWSPRVLGQRVRGRMMPRSAPGWLRPGWRWGTWRPRRTRLGDVADDDLAGVMGRRLTTLVGQLDGLRVAVTQRVRARGVFRRQGAASVAGWLRADVRTADVAWSLSRLAARAAELPKITGLLAQGSASLAQAGAACWQIAHLPDVPRPSPARLTERSALLDPAPGDEPWAGLWCHGDVHAVTADAVRRVHAKAGQRGIASPRDAPAGSRRRAGARECGLRHLRPAGAAVVPLAGRRR